MPDPRISVILNTARGDFPMLDRPDTWIFDPTMRSLAAQTFRDFDVVIVDALRGRRSEAAVSAGAWRDVGAPVQWFPFPDSPWYRAGYVAISAPKNEALVHCDGEVVVQLDDCCSFGPDFLAVCWETCQRGFNAAAFVDYARGGVSTQTDGRRRFLRGGAGRARWVAPAAFGYTAFRLDDALRLNGWDEGYDGSKCLEDADFAERMHMLGRWYRFDERLAVTEHEHGDVSPDAWPAPPPTPWGGRSIKCNAVHDQITRTRAGEDRLQANRRQYTDAEWALYGPPCRYYAGVTRGDGVGRCALGRGLECNWLAVPGDPESENRIGADPNWPHIRDWAPVFDLAERWRERRRGEGKGTEVVG